MLVLFLTWAITGTVAITGTGTATGSNLDDTEVVIDPEVRATVGDFSHHRYLGFILDQSHFVKSAAGRIFNSLNRKSARRVGRHFDNQKIALIATRAENFNRGEIIIARLQ